MKQRFSSLDIKVIAHELSNALVALRLANVYDLSSKIFLLKFAKPDDKKQMVVDSGFRCHLTKFSRTTAAAPSVFVARLRKCLKTRRVTSVSQVGTDRIIEIQFSDGQYRLFLEFYAGGNIILTDKELNILALLRSVPEGEGQEELRTGLKYSLESRQNYGGIPELTKDRLREVLQRAVDKAEDTAAGKKSKKDSGILRKALAVSITEFPPLLIDHSMHVTGFDATLKPVEVLENENLIQKLMLALEEAKNVVQEVTSSEASRGYIISKPRGGSKSPNADAESDEKPSLNLVYDDFHPFRPMQFVEDPNCYITEIDGFNNTVDEFFSSIEVRQLESRLHERELTAKKKLEAARKDQAKRLDGLQEIQELNVRKANAIEANRERVQEAMDAVNSLIASGKDWVEIEKLIEFEQKRHNPVADIIKLPLYLERNTIALLLGEEEFVEDNEDAYATESGMSDSEDEASKTQTAKKAADKQLVIDINLGMSPWSNAREYHDHKRSAAAKEAKTAQAFSKAMKSQEQKITQELKRGLKQEKPVLRPVRHQLWFERFIWFISSDGYLVLAGRDAQQNEILYKKYLRKGDIYVHADLHGAATVVVRNILTSDMPIPPSTLSQAGTLAVAASNAWESKAGMSAWWVNADQVSKSAQTGEFLPTGSFMVRGKKNFLPPAQLLLGFAFTFRVSEESKAKHLKHRLHEDPFLDGGAETDRLAADGSQIEDSKSGIDYESGDDIRNEERQEVETSDDEDDTKSMEGRLNPLDSSAYDAATDKLTSTEPVHETLTVAFGNQGIQQASSQTPFPELTGLRIKDAPIVELDSEKAADSGDNEDSGSDSEQANTGTTTPHADRKKNTPLPRGKRSKAKKVAAKYKDQDEEDRQAAQTLIGSALGLQKAEAEEKAKVRREAEAAFQRERRRAQHQRNQKETAEHEEVRKLMLEEGIEVLDDEEAEKTTLLDAFVGTPLPGDEIIEALPVCAPWAALGKYKYKAKLQPGAQKKGKAVKEIFDRWIAASSGKGVVDHESRDTERMWPREIDLIRSWKPEECINCVPVSKVRVMMAGGSAGTASKGATGKGRGGKGSKKQR